MIMCRNRHYGARVHQSYDPLVVDRSVDIYGIDPLLGDVVSCLSYIADYRHAVNALKISRLEQYNAYDLISCLLVA